MCDSQKGQRGGRLSLQKSPLGESPVTLCSVPHGGGMDHWESPSANSVAPVQGLFLGRVHTATLITRTSHTLPPSRDGACLLRLEALRDRDQFLVYVYTAPSTTGPRSCLGPPGTNAREYVQDSREEAPVVDYSAQPLQCLEWGPPTAGPSRAAMPVPARAGVRDRSRSPAFSARPDTPSWEQSSWSPSHGIVKGGGWANQGPCTHFGPCGAHRAVYQFLAHPRSKGFALPASRSWGQKRHNGGSWGALDHVPPQGTGLWDRRETALAPAPALVSEAGTG